MPKRAAIYIRVSSEKQSEKVSPQIQKQECQKYCEDFGYKIIEVYSDIEKYRSGRRLVSPSGRRNDRPQFKRMLRDIDAGRLDIIIAWKEDRLYRGVTRAMLELSDRVAQNKVVIELVKENYDPTIAAVKAWAAGFELQSKNDRMNMGIGARLAEGKVWPTSIPYGYQANDEGYAIENLSESIWVKNIWNWAGQNKPIRWIRNKLLEEDAPQRSAKGIPWQNPFIYSILRNDVYYTGIQIINWDGQIYEIPYPTIVDQATANKVAQRKAKNKAFPARNVKHNYLAMGYVNCVACNVKMSSYTSYAYKNGKRTNRIKRYYRCKNFLAGYPAPDCAHTVSVKKVDAILWEKVWSVFEDREIIENGIRARVEQLRDQEYDTKKDVEMIERRLENLSEERRWVITQGRKKIITESDMEYQLGILTAEERDLLREYTEKSISIDNQSERLLHMLDLFRKETFAGVEIITATPSNDKIAKLQYKYRRKIVETIVRRVNINKDKNVNVEFEIRLPTGDDIKSAPHWWR